MKKLSAILCAIGILAACSPKITAFDNPPLPGFNTTASDAKAISIADEVMRAMGGRQAWDDTRYLSWNFFNRRKLLWDKHAGICRIDWVANPLSIVVNLNEGTGRVSLNGIEQNHPDSLAKYLDMGKKVWINDAYWLVMPFKLKDSGVTLKYLGNAQTESGEASDLLQMTFAGVGVTPDNKYHVWVDKKTRLVTQWAYFPKFSDTTPVIVNAWGAYKRCGHILLSTERGSRGSLEPVEVLEHLGAEAWSF